jgi:hypothetical protein
VAPKARYEKHRKELLFTPFKKVEARRVWSAETPIELFLIQALAKEDGATFPSLYHLWQDVEFRHSDGLVTEADLYFFAERVAVFCDGAYHSRGKQKTKDAAINTKLEAVGIRAVRISGSEIKFELPKAVSRVKETLAAASPPQEQAGAASGQPLAADS